MAEKKKKTAPEDTASSEQVTENAAPETVSREEYDKLNDTYLRLLAEFTNYKKRTDKEKTAIYGDATAFAVGSLLTVKDTLEIAASQSCGDEKYKEGVLLTLKSMDDVFSKLGVTEIGQTGVPFDPNIHNAVMSEENEELPENTVSMVLQKGYKIGEKVIRPAAVKVANA